MSLLLPKAAIQTNLVTLPAWLKGANNFDDTRAFSRLTAVRLHLELYRRHCIFSLEGNPPEQHSISLEATKCNLPRAPSFYSSAMDGCK